MARILSAHSRDFYLFSLFFSSFSFLFHTNYLKKCSGILALIQKQVSVMSSQFCRISFLINYYRWKYENSYGMGFTYYGLQYIVLYDFKLLNMPEKQIYTWWNMQIRCVIFFPLFTLWNKTTASNLQYLCGTERVNLTNFSWIST